VRAPREAILVRPSGPLSGRVAISGAKNSVLKVMAATLLAPGTYTIRNVPQIHDVTIMGELLEAMGATVRQTGSVLHVVVGDDIVPEAPYELVEKMRASVVVLGPLLARFGEARVALPGGDDFGSRPIDIHLRALTELGAQIETKRGFVVARAEQLLGARIILDFPSVTATENVLMAAVRAKGVTVIDNAAREPEVADLAGFLNRMGANIVGAGTSTITVDGVDELRATDHTIIPDRIEAATFLAAVGVAGGEITLTGARPDHMDMLCLKLGDMGMRISPAPDGLWAMVNRRLTSVDVSTLPYPGIATDYKPLIVALLALCDGVGIVTENLFSGRFRYVDELVRMGADIRTEGHHAVVRGVAQLSGAPVKAPDIRAGAALVVAALRAEGETLVNGVHHIDRGYEDFVGKLRGIGADVTRVEL
jgi:UDP-N-acetylglucosamine 1-carboxyvinyltransferase